MEMLRAIERLFENHAPETLMAIFGVGTSLLLFYLVWAVLQQLFGVQRQSAEQVAEHEQVTTVLVESLVAALVKEAGHLRQTMDGILHELLRAGTENAAALTDLQTQSDHAPQAVAQLLKPEFDLLHQTMHDAETRIIAKVLETAGPTDEQVEPASRELP